MILNPARRKTTPRKKPTRKPAVRRKTTPKKRVTRRKPAARKTTPKRRVRRMKRNPVGINLVQDAALVAGGALAVRVLPQFIPQTKQFDNGIGGYAMNAGLAVLPMFFAKKASHKKLATQFALGGLAAVALRVTKDILAKRPSGPQLSAPDNEPTLEEFLDSQGISLSGIYLAEDDSEYEEFDDEFDDDEGIIETEEISGYFEEDPSMEVFGVDSAGY